MTSRNRRIWSTVFRYDARRSSCRNYFAYSPGRDPLEWTTTTSAVYYLGCWTAATGLLADTTCLDPWKARPVTSITISDYSHICTYVDATRGIKPEYIFYINVTWIGIFMHPKKSSWLPDLALWAICLKNLPRPLTPLTSFNLLTASNTEDSSSWSLAQSINKIYFRVRMFDRS